jgi:hypothetical protein
MKRSSAFLALLFLAATPLFAQTSSGTLTANGKTTQLDHVVAARDKEGKVHVLLSNQTVTPDQILSHAVEFDLAGPKGTFSGVAVEFDKSGQIISGSFYSPTFTKMGGSFSASGMHKFEGKVTASSVEGKLFMDKQDDFFDNKYIYSAKFSVPIGGPSKPAPPAAPKGKPLPTDGGEPAKAYRAYLKTIQAGNITQIRNSVTVERSKQVSDKDMKEMIPMLQAMAPKNLKITGGAVDGDHATLLATSQDGKELMQGTITMAKETGAWKVELESWKN